MAGWESHATRMPVVMGVCEMASGIPTPSIVTQTTRGLDRAVWEDRLEEQHGALIRSHICLRVVNGLVEAQDHANA